MEMRKELNNLVNLETKLKIILILLEEIYYQIMDGLIIFQLIFKINIVFQISLKIII